MSYRIILFLILCFGFLWNCKSEQDDVLAPVRLECSPERLVLDSEAQDTVIHIQCTTNWIITGDTVGCKCTPASGYGNADVFIRMNENDSDTLRKLHLIIYAETEKRIIEIFQTGKNNDSSPFCSFTLVEPQMNVTNVVRYTRFRWQVEDMREDSVKFIVSWSKDQKNWVNSPSQSDLVYTVKELLEPDTKYFWKITALTATGKRCESRIRSFITGKNTYYEGYVITIEENRKENPVNLVFMGDGFRREDYEDGTFVRIVREAINGLFIREPFPTYRSYFNIYAVVAISSERGLSDRGTKKNTVFEMTYRPTTESLLSISVEPVYEYAVLVPGVEDLTKTPIAVIGYDSRYAGLAGTELSGRAFGMMTWAGGGSAFTDLVAHEFGGHVIGMLGDEYFSNQDISGNESDLRRVRQFQDAGWYQNIALTDDSAKVPWRHFIGLPGYEEVGIYKGGRFYSEGVWRSSYSSCMSTEARRYYNAPSREAIVKRILSMAGESYSFEKFLEKDKSVDDEKE